MKTKVIRIVTCRNLAFCLIFFLLIFTGCGKRNAIRNTDDEQVLRERVTAYWDHKVKGQFDKSYEYEDPFFRKNVSMTKYIQSMPAGRIAWTGSRIGSVAITGDRADVALMVTIVIAAGSKKQLEQDTNLTEKWVKVDGVWYHVFEKGRRVQTSN